MAIKKLVPASHPILTKKAQAVKTLDDSLKRLLH
ncbi:peptide deformylase, partial [Staphylococcus aureus]